MRDLCPPSPASPSRRRLMLGAGSLLALSTLPLGRARAEQLTTSASNAILPDAALQR